jgi:hypothetical protein
MNSRSRRSEEEIVHEHIRPGLPHGGSGFLQENDMKRLFAVDIDIRVYVYAEANEAKDTALEWLGGEYECRAYGSIDASEPTWIQGHWKDQCPYGEKNGRTCREIFEAQQDAEADARQMRLDGMED